MPAKTWKPIRLTAQTCELLEQVKTSLERAHERGQRTLTHGPKGEITNDETVRILAELFLDHKRRGNGGKAPSPAVPKATPSGRTHQRDLLFPES